MIAVIESVAQELNKMKARRNQVSTSQEDLQAYSDVLTSVIYIGGYPAYSVRKKRESCSVSCGAG